MNIQDLDPDTQIRERVFQPIVDRAQIDPEQAAKAVYRLHLVGLLVGGAMGWALLLKPMAAAGVGPFSPPLAMVPFLGNSLWIGLILRSAPYRSMGPLQAVSRLGYVVSALLILWIAGYSWIERWPPPAIVCTILLAVAWTAGPCALYLHICRRPPPRKKAPSVPRVRTVHT